MVHSMETIVSYGMRTCTNTNMLIESSFPINIIEETFKASICFDVYPEYFYFTLDMNIGHSISHNTTFR